MYIKKYRLNVIYYTKKLKEITAQWKQTMRIKKLLTGVFFQNSNLCCDMYKTEALHQFKKKNQSIDCNNSFSFSLFFFVFASIKEFQHVAIVIISQVLRFLQNSLPKKRAQIVTTFVYSLNIRGFSRQAPQQNSAESTRDDLFSPLCSRAFRHGSIFGSFKWYAK